MDWKKFFMPTKFKLVLMILLFLVLPAPIFHPYGVAFVFLGGPAIISVMDIVGSWQVIVALIEAYIVSCIIFWFVGKKF